MLDLCFGETMVTSHQHPSTHYLIGFCITIGAGFVRTVFKSGLTKNITGKYCAGLDITLL